MPLKRKLNKTERRIIASLLREVDESVAKAGGPEHNSYYAIEDVLTLWKDKLKEK